ncbi:enoyl-CoA hydratase-related protein [Micromonospora sp. NPDC018662]|uniref:enoyl-CoA hydratase-related protein n=1 Tax=Micromonospora sp. NPDC018662 TaxID=3364238 RepID=UPI0037890D37
MSLTRGRGLLRVDLARPEHRNRIDASLLTELAAAVDEAERDPDCRVLVLSASGEDFCAGTDLSDGPPDAADLRGAAGVELPYWRMLDRLARGELVTVAVVDGRATAGGVGLAAACDLVLAGARARFRLTEVLVGLVPAMALPFVARRVGEQRAFTATLLAEDLDSAAAVSCGLADLAAEDVEALLRRVLAGLGRVDRGTAAALKRYRARLFSRDPALGRDASALLLDRLADPTARRLLERLRATGVMVA